ncbi:LTA synthase family protein [Carnobacterium pleistocenium]|uniref:LTA synthase family protein n=1 Tax=Carnobacterium pleistocenium TaxID=181073 RepID=UPI0006912EB7|nr:alkaline phosphatase family protein [Carnobacterium pleistocenium]
MENKKVFRIAFLKLFITTFIGLSSSFFAFLILEYFHLSMNFEAVINFFTVYTKLSILQIIVIFLFFLFANFILYSKFLSFLILSVFAIIIGIVSHFKIEFRGEPVYPSDVAFLKDISFFIEIVNFKAILLIIFGIVLVLTIFILFFKFRTKKNISKFTIGFRVIGLIIVSLMLIYIYQFNSPGNKVKAAFNEYVNWISYSQEKNYTRNGVVSGLLYNLKSPAIDRPKDYSQERIEEIVKKYSKEAEGINNNRNGEIDDINIIYIMNETFSDAHRLDGFTINGGDSLENYREFSQEQMYGQVLSQAYGGGTANIEFEALTGISLEPLSGNISIPYIHLSDKLNLLPTITDYVKASNHNLTAIHPHNSTMYKRIDNYKTFGFDQMRFKDDMKYTDVIDQSPYISDEASYKEVMDVMDNTDEKDFIHLVTMQNHMRYSGKYDDIEFKVKGVPETAEAENYLKGIQYSDIALKEYLKELDSYDEKVMVVFWGDHLPSFYGKELVELNGYQKMHETPLMFYTNFIDEKKDIGTISPIYFTNYILEIANAKVSPFVALLEKMKQALPAFEKNFYLERETGVKNSREKLKPSTQLLLKEYDLILYDITTGKNYSKDLKFY